LVLKRATLDVGTPGKDIPVEPQPDVLADILSQLDEALAALTTYLVTRHMRPEALGVVRGMQWTMASLRVALGLMPGVR
jgi:hypothetical protein